jgi:peptide/nickel transport system permease protein
MLRYVIRRLIAAFAILLIVSFLAFMMFFALPASPAVMTCGKNCTQTNLDRINRSLGLNDPILVQYKDYMLGIPFGRTFGKGGEARHCPAPCLGFSFKTDQPVLKIILDRAPATFSLAIGAATLWLVFGCSMGIISALKQGTLLDKTAITIALMGASLQIYSVALVARYLFVDKLKLMDNPYYTSFTDNPLQWAQGLLLPWLTLAFIFAAIYARLARSSMIETLSEDYIRTARAKGLPKRRVYLKHALRGAVTPIVTVFGLDLAGILTGAVITETVFNLPGLGKATLDAIRNYDLPLIMATVLFASAIIVLFNILVDVIYAFLDPRVRLA